MLRWAATKTRKGIRVSRSHQYLDKTTTFTLGPVDVSVLWPPAPPAGAPNAPYDATNENNNSLVLVLRLGDVRLVLTGDCQAENWSMPSAGGAWPIPLPAKGLKLMQVPHHGARNGLFDASGGTPLLDQVAALASADATVEPLLAVSCHPEPHGHPHPNVASRLDGLATSGLFGTCVPPTRWLRTDKNLHYSIWTDGTSVETRARPPF
jgi:beta-lactamase superfamily II metal-dependent hydrolase